jgi:signal peptidase I
MESAIRTGLWLWIDKLTYGGRLPERWADIPLINAFTHIASLRITDAQNYWSYRRLPGFTKPKTGDIVVFNNTHNEETLLVKRITKIKQEDNLILYFLMGDNREKSNDSRTFGWVLERLIVGKVNL